jgi:hypothetical protein
VTFPLGIPVTLIQRTKGTPDALGNDTWTEQRTDTRGVFNPGGSTETVQGQDLLTIQPTLVVPAGTDVSYIDAIEVPTGGDRYEVDGSPNNALNVFTGWNPGIVVKLKRVAG